MGWHGSGTVPFLSAEGNMTLEEWDKLFLEKIILSFRNPMVIEGEINHEVHKIMLAHGNISISEFWHKNVLYIAGKPAIIIPWSWPIHLKLKSEDKEMWYEGSLR
jgi:hypothetical protein